MNNYGNNAILAWLENELKNNKEFADLWLNASEEEKQIFIKNNSERIQHIPDELNKKITEINKKLNKK